MRTLILAAATLATWSATAMAVWVWIPNPPAEFETTKVKLGETFLMNRTDADFLAVDGGKVCGLAAFKIGVRGDGARIDDLKVLFVDNSFQDLDVREQFARGTDSRWVDLAGETRCIKGIFVMGKSRSNTPRETKVVFFGVKVENEGEKLGETQLMNSNDADFIDLAGRNCGKREFKIKVRGDDARIENVTVQFQRGGTQEIPLRDIFRAGSSSDWKDLDGGNRCIDKVFIFGRSSNMRPRETTVEFWAR